MPEVSIQRYALRFLAPAGTSRGVLTTRETWFVRWTETPGRPAGIGECALFRGLSADDRPDYAERLAAFAARLSAGEPVPDDELRAWPSIRFGFEMARADARQEGTGLLFPSAFTEGREGLLLNGLVWMGSAETMARQAREKWDQGFRCLKFKVGALDFEDELAMLRRVRAAYPADILEIRLDANGVWTPDEAARKLDRLACLAIHSIEQPLRAGQPEALAALGARSPIPLALDEELIGTTDPAAMDRLVCAVRPAYLVLKPTLLGGLAATEEWIDCAERHGIGWWITSALESNVGLNALAQWTFRRGTRMVSGLGTGGLFQNNIPSPLRLRGPRLFYDPGAAWDYSALSFPASAAGDAR